MKTAWMKIAARIRAFLNRMGEDFDMSLVDGWTAFSVNTGSFERSDDILFA